MHNLSFLALGSNVGDREKNLIDAIKLISSLETTNIEAVSNIYETEPVGFTEQESFLNLVVSVKTALEPLTLLGQLQSIEISLKRTREIHWGPRTMDIDILLYGDARFDLPTLIIPHPRMFERAFVLVPLKDIYDGITFNNVNITDLIEKCADKDGVRLFKEFTVNF